MDSKLKIGGTFFVKCFDSNGNLKWKDDAKNLITNAGLNHILDVVLHGTTPVSPWYIGLKLTGTVLAADTMATHANWSETTAYVGDRKEYEEGAASSQSTTNGTAADFVMSGSATVTGAFLCPSATAATEPLLCAADFTGGDKAVTSGDTISVTYTISAADA